MKQPKLLSMVNMRNSSLTLYKLTDDETWQVYR